MSERTFLPYGQQTIDEDDIQAVAEVLRGDWLTTGPAVEQFEIALALAEGVSNAVAVNSGTAALHAAYEALGVGPGDTVVTSPLTFVATASCALHLGADVRFADVSPDTGNLDPRSVEETIDANCKLVVAVDFAGHLADYPALRKIAEQHDCAVISDAAHSFGARRNGQSSAQHADCATTSFHPVKGLTTAEGGAVLTQREDIAERARRFRNHGIERNSERHRNPGGAWHYEVQSLGLNYRIPDVLCALGLSQLQKFDSFLARRREISVQYTLAFAEIGTIDVPFTEPDVEPSWHLYVVRVRDAKRREAFFDGLRALGIGVQLHYHPVHLHPFFEDIGFKAGSCPVAEDFAARSVSLPIHPGLRPEDTERVIEAVRECARNFL